MAILQMAASSFRPDAALIELGVDSLVAVEIRTWFLKEVTVDIAVLKILGGASTISLCQYAVEQMPKDLLSGINSIALDADPKVKKTIDSAARGIPTEVKPISTKDSSESGSPAGFTPSPTHESPASSVAHEDTKPTPEVERLVRISSAQSRFWFLNMFLADQTASNITFSYQIRGRVHVADLARAVKAVGQAHEALRTCFQEGEDTEIAWQGVMKTSKLALEHRNISTDDEIRESYTGVRNTVYDLGQGETMQVVLLSKDATSHTIIFGYHHIVLDGSGFEIFLADLEGAYSRKSPLPQGLQYSSFSEKEGLAIKEGILEKKLSYWRLEFQEIPPILPLLPVSKVTSRQAISRYGSSYVEHRLDAKVAASIKEICKGLHVTPSHFYLATFRVMLMRLARVEDLCIGVADANRHDSNTMSTVGLFLNMLPIHFKQSTNVPFGEILRETRAKVYEALAQAGVPFDELLQGKKARSLKPRNLFLCEKNKMN